MPRRDDLKTILLIGSGPIIIGQACEPFVILEHKLVKRFETMGTVWS